MLERVEGGKHQVSVCAGTPAVLGWATGNLAEPRNNPQVGMANMRTIMPALQKAKTATLAANGLQLLLRRLPKQQRDNPRRQRHDARRDRRRAGRVDRSRITHGIHSRTHAPAETGSALTKASLEAVTAGHELAAQRARSSIGIVAADARIAASCLASTGATFFPSPAKHLRSRAMQPTPPHAKLSAAPPAPPSSSLLPARDSPASPPESPIASAASSTRTSLPSAASGRKIEATRWFYRQRIEAVLTRDSRPWFLLLEAGTHAPSPETPRRSSGRNEVRTPRASAPPSPACARPSRMQQTIRPDAKLLFVAGAGWTKKQPDGQTHTAEAGDLILGFLAPPAHRSAAASRSSTRAAKGNSVLPFLTHMNQIGQTGATPRHAKGLSTCCHGEEPHVVGWRFIAERRAISLDPNCGWTRGKADVVYVADAFQVMSKVNELLEARKA